jgi:hypothetical protein
MISVIAHAFEVTLGDDILCMLVTIKLVGILPPPPFVLERTGRERKKDGVRVKKSGAIQEGGWLVQRRFHPRPLEFYFVWVFVASLISVWVWESKSRHNTKTSLQRSIDNLQLLGMKAHKAIIYDAI